MQTSETVGDSSIFIVAVITLSNERGGKLWTLFASQRVLLLIWVNGTRLTLARGMIGQMRPLQAATDCEVAAWGRPGNFDRPSNSCACVASHFSSGKTGPHSDAFALGIYVPARALRAQMANATYSAKKAASFPKDRKLSSSNELPHKARASKNGGRHSIKTAHWHRPVIRA